MLLLFILVSFSGKRNKKAISEENNIVYNIYYIILYEYIYPQTHTSTYVHMKYSYMYASVCVFEKEHSEKRDLKLTSGNQRSLQRRDII